jgi:transcriptional regulator of heat shock response
LRPVHSQRTLSLPQDTSDHHREEESNSLKERLRQMNRHVLTDSKWGDNPTDIPKKQIRKIEKKAVFQMEHRLKSNSQLLVRPPQQIKRKERNFIESVKNRSHLPPPPLGRTFGHGISTNLPAIQAYSQTKYL